MKNRRTVTGLLLLAVVSLMLSGCGAFQVQMAKTTTRMAKLDNLHTDVEAYAEARMNIGGQRVHMDATVTGGFDMALDPLLLRTDLHLSTLGVERDVRMYIQKEYDTWTFAPWEEDRPIDEATIEEHSAKRSRAVQALKLLIKCGDFFQDPVDDMVNDTPAQRYDGILPEEYVNEALVLLNIMEEEPQRATESEENAASSTAAASKESDEGSNTGGENKTEEASEEEQSVPEGIPASMWVNDDGMIIQVDLELASFLQNLMDRGLEDLQTDYDLDGLILESELEYVDVRLTFSQFDEVPALRLPDN